MTWTMDDPQWTAYVLDELDDVERAKLERILANDAAAQTYVASLRETIAALDRELATQPGPAALDDLRRARIHSTASSSSSRSRPHSTLRQRNWWLAGGATAALGIAAVALTNLGSADRTRSSDVGAIPAPQRVAAMRAEQAVDALAEQIQVPPSQPQHAQVQALAQQERVAALQKLRQLRAEKDRMEAKLQSAKQGADRAERLKGIAIDEAMLNNPLAGGKHGIKVNLPAGQAAPDRGPSTEAYDRIDDNPFFATRKEPLSTFSIDVDTAAWSNVRRFISEGRRPPKDAVRTEELINYFTYDYPAPVKGEPFSITTEVGPSPWHAKHQLMRVGIATAAIEDAQVPPRNLVFLIDVSGSMEPANKLPLLVQSMGLLVETLRPEDKVSIVVYAGAAGTVLPPTSGRDKETIRGALARLQAGGATNGAQGIKLAYELAGATFIKNGINRVVLCTDGDYNVGITSEGDLTRLIEKERARGVFLTVLGFGMGNLKDATMEKLADRGNGNYAYIDSLAEARKVLVEQAGATLITVAKDVKLQVEFNPALVAGHRLIGYENRILAHQDFNDDKKDAGEIGAGHTVTAIYEIVPAGVDVPGKTDDLKYQTPGAPSAASATGELATVKVRYKPARGDTSKVLSQVVVASAAQAELAKTSDDFRWAAAIAGFGMLLRDSPHRANLTWPQVQAIAGGAVGRDDAGYRKQALASIRAAAKLPDP
jgi:Ca-activated chloride channel homolog